MVNDVLFFVGIVKGDQARYPFKLRSRPLVTIPIVVAVLRKTKTAVNQRDCGFLMPSHPVTGV